MSTALEDRTGRRWWFLRHYLEMVAAMLVGMVVTGAMFAPAVALTRCCGRLPWPRTKRTDAANGA
jgi:hypothetical protein